MIPNNSSLLTPKFKISREMGSVDKLARSNLY
jgi:hypothetical protein